MLCAISGEAPQQPVASRKSGNVFEKRLIEAYIAENGTDPVTGEELSVDDLINLRQSRTVNPRPPTLTSIPALLSTFQNEWDALVLETFQLKQALSESRQELSTALYYNDSALRVVARLTAERDEARAALSRINVSAGTNGHDAMQIDNQGLSSAIIEKIDSTQQRLSATRRKRPVPADWTTTDDIASYSVKATADSQFTGSRSLAVDVSGDFCLCGDSDGTLGVFDLQQNTFTTRSSLSSGGIIAEVWAGDKSVAATTTGAVVISQAGNVSAKFSQHAGPARDVSSHPCGTIIASVGEDKSYILYDVEDERVLTQVSTDKSLTTVAFHPDGHLLAIGAEDGSTLLFDVKTFQLAHTFPSPIADSPVVALDFSENGTWLACAHGSSTNITIFHLGKLNIFKVLDAGFNVTSISWDYTGQFLAATGPGGLVISAYDKGRKAWSEPLRKSIGEGAVDVKWGTKGKSVIILTNEGSITVLG